MGDDAVAKKRNGHENRVDRPDGEEVLEDNWTTVIEEVQNLEICPYSRRLRRICRDESSVLDFWGIT